MINDITEQCMIFTRFCSFTGASDGWLVRLVTAWQTQKTTNIINIRILHCYVCSDMYRVEHKKVEHTCYR